MRLCGPELFQGGEEPMTCEVNSNLSKRESRTKRRRNQRLNYLSSLRSATSPSKKPSSRSQTDHSSLKSSKTHLYPRGQRGHPSPKSPKSLLYPKGQRGHPSLRNVFFYLLLFHFPVSNCQRLFTAGVLVILFIDILCLNINWLRTFLSLFYCQNSVSSHGWGAAVLWFYGRNQFFSGEANGESGWRCDDADYDDYLTMIIWWC